MKKSLLILMILTYSLFGNDYPSKKYKPSCWSFIKYFGPPSMKELKKVINSVEWDLKGTKCKENGFFKASPIIDKGRNVYIFFWERFEIRTIVKNKKHIIVFEKTYSSFKEYLTSPDSVYINKLFGFLEEMERFKKENKERIKKRKFFDFGESMWETYSVLIFLVNGYIGTAEYSNGVEILRSDKWKIEEMVCKKTPLVVEAIEGFDAEIIKNYNKIRSSTCPKSGTYPVSDSLITENKGDRFHTMGMFDVDISQLDYFN